MSQRTHDRRVERSFADVPVGQEPDLFEGVTYDGVDGEPLYIRRFRIDTPGVTVVGVPSDWEVGDWFVSPELARRMESDERLQMRFPDARVIGNEGVGVADELVAYRFVGPEVELRWPHAMGSTGEGWGGPLPAIRPSNALWAGAGLVFVIGVGVLWAALGPVGLGLERRLGVLSALGATPWGLLWVVGVSVAVVVVPGVAAGVLLWVLVSPGLVRVPLVGDAVLAGDLALPWWMGALVGVMVVALCVGLAVLHPKRSPGSRPSAVIPQRPRWWRVAPLGLSVGIIGLAVTRSGLEAVRLLLTGVIAASLCVVLALPVLTSWAGRALVRGRSVLALLVGSRLRWSASVSARPLTALASLAVLVPIGASYIAANRADDPPQPEPTFETVFLNGDFDAETLTTLERRAGGVFVKAYSEHVPGPQPSVFTLVVDCDRLPLAFDMLECGPEGVVPGPGVSSTLRGVDMFATTPPPRAEFEGNLLVTTDLYRADSVLRAYVANADRSGIWVRTKADDEFKESPLVPWILTAIGIAATGALLALLLWVVTSAAQGAGTRMRLFGIGASPGTIRGIAAAEAASVVLIVGLGGAVVGAVGAKAYAEVTEASFTYWWASITFAAATVVAAAAAACAAAGYVQTTTTQTALRVQD